MTIIQSIPKMETGGLARKEVQIIETYFNYWREHIKPIEDKHRVVQFEHILNQVAAELYGPRIAFELAVRFFLDDKEPLPMATDR
ncbi:MAG: hypothetical protein J5I98_19895 [Phaeodactylibacter sp.]|nr:hypothetical protein [Phaeodactylibacter sp.]